MAKVCRMTKELKNIAIKKFNPIYREKFFCQNSTFASSPDTWGCFLLNNLSAHSVIGSIIVSKTIGQGSSPCEFGKKIGLINTLYIHREPYSKNKGLTASITRTKNGALPDDLTTPTLQFGSFNLVSVAMSKFRYQTD